MIWGIGTPSACERSLTVTPDSTVTGPVGGRRRAGAAAAARSLRSRGWRARGGVLPPPSMTTRRFRPRGPCAGRIGRFGLFGPSAIGPSSVETREPGSTATVCAACG